MSYPGTEYQARVTTAGNMLECHVYAHDNLPIFCHNHGACASKSDLPRDQVTTSFDVKVG
jgi:hypothetical protein